MAGIGEVLGKAALSASAEAPPSIYESVGSAICQEAITELSKPTQIAEVDSGKRIANSVDNLLSSLIDPNRAESIQLIVPGDSEDGENKHGQHLGEAAKLEHERLERQEKYETTMANIRRDLEKENAEARKSQAFYEKAAMVAGTTALLATAVVQPETVPLMLATGGALLLTSCEDSAPFPYLKKQTIQERCNDTYTCMVSGGKIEGHKVDNCFETTLNPQDIDGSWTDNRGIKEPVTQCTGALFTDNYGKNFASAERAYLQYPLDHPTPSSQTDNTSPGDGQPSSRPGGDPNNPNAHCEEKPRALVYQTNLPKYNQQDDFYRTAFNTCVNQQKNTSDCDTVAGFCNDKVFEAPRERPNLNK